MWTLYLYNEHSSSFAPQLLHSPFTGQTFLRWQVHLHLKHSHSDLTVFADGSGSVPFWKSAWMSFPAPSGPLLECPSKDFEFWVLLETNTINTSWDINNVSEQGWKVPSLRSKIHTLEHDFFFTCFVPLVTKAQRAGMNLVLCNIRLPDTIAHYHSMGGSLYIYSFNQVVVKTVPFVFTCTMANVSLYLGYTFQCTLSTTASTLSHVKSWGCNISCFHILNCGILLLDFRIQALSNRNMKYA